MAEIKVRDIGKIGQDRCKPNQIAAWEYQGEIKPVNEMFAGFCRFVGNGEECWLGGKIRN